MIYCDLMAPENYFQQENISNSVELALIDLH